MTDLRITRRRNAKNVTARRHPDGTIRISIPSWMSERDARRAIDSVISRLNATAPPEWTPRFLPGTKIACGNSIITISVSSTDPDRLTALRSTEGWIVAIGSNLRPGEKATDLAVNRLLIRISRAEAPRFLLPIAERTAARIRRNPTRWQIAHGHKTLGSCFSDGRISLSEILIFLPVRLIDYVICHELAHLTEMNHSRKFHDLCNRYCNGLEKQLERELKAFSWPIIR